MRRAAGFFAFTLMMFVLGCGERVAKFEGPTVDKFTGKLVQNGQPVSFDGEDVEVKLFHEKGQSFGIPIKGDGSFQIGWMPIGNYSATLTRKITAGAKKASIPGQYAIPGGLKIEDGKTDYTIELGKGFKK